MITIITNLGDRYADPVMNQAPSDPQQSECWTGDFICYSEAFAKFGKAIDDGIGRARWDD